MRANRMDYTRHIVCKDLPQSIRSGPRPEPQKPNLMVPEQWEQMVGERREEGAFIKYLLFTDYASAVSVGPLLSGAGNCFSRRG